MEQQSSSKTKKPISKNLIWAIISSVLAILTICMVFKQSKDVSLSDLIHVIGSSNKLVFVLGVLAALLYIWFEGVAIQSILKRAGYKRGPMSGLLYSTSDVYFSAITPSATGGQPASAFFMMRDGIPAGMATATLVLNLMMYTVSIIVLGFLAIVICPSAFFAFSELSKVLIIIGFILLTILSCVFFIVLKKENLIFNPLSKFISFLHKKKIIKESFTDKSADLCDRNCWKISPNEESDILY